MKLWKIILTVAVGLALVTAGVSIGLMVRPGTSLQPAEAPEYSGYAANPAHEYLAGSAMWQLSAEAHALMMQGFNIATENIGSMAQKADEGVEGYHWVEEDGARKLYLNDRRVCVVCDIDDTLVDGVHYTANIIGRNGEWNNKAFTEFIMSDGCTPLPGALDFTGYCAENGVAIFYVTNRYDQGYKLSEAGYGGQEGYRKADGTVIGSSTNDIFGRTMYDITMDSMAALGFPVNTEGAANYYADACLIVNDNKLNGSSKEPVRQAISDGGEWSTGERAAESGAYPDSIDLDAHHIAMLLGDDLNDISMIFSSGETNAVDRVALAIENMYKWGTEWIVFPNAVYGSSMNYALDYGPEQLFSAFDYTEHDSATWDMYGAD